MINIIKLKLEDIILDDSMVINEFSQEIFDKLKFQIARGGELYPLLVRLTKNGYELIDGYTRYAVYLKLNMSECHVNVLENVSDYKARLIKLELNVQNEFDVLKVANSLTFLKEKISAESMSKTINHTTKQIELFQGIYEWDWSIFDGGAIPHELKEKMSIQDMKNKVLF